jgi:hypothetical protein
MEKRNYFIAAILLALIFFGIWNFTHDRSHYDAGRPPASRPELDAEAWKVLQDQLRWPYSSETPSWDTDRWFTKCAVGLMDCGQDPESFLFNIDDPSSGTKRHRLSPETLFRLSTSMRAPRQNLAGRSVHGSRNDFEFLEKEPAQLASVLLNKAARDSLLSVVSNWKTGTLSSVAMQPGSILAKAIWKGVPMEGQIASDAEDFYIYPPRNRLDNGDGTGDQAPTLDVHRDFDAIIIDANQVADNSSCALSRRVDPEPSRRHISPDCFHGYLLKAKSDLLPKTVSTIDLPPTAIVYSACMNRPCYYILLGIHFMVRLGSDDPLYRDGAPWLFITFWWTGQDNKVFAGAPWKYYQMNVTQVERDDPRAGYPPNICYNPYLEGPLPNGAVSNCASCHKFARISLDKTATSAQDIGVGDCFGSRAFPFTGANSKGDPCDREALIAYDQRRIKADFVWSLAHLNDPKN